MWTRRGGSNHVCCTLLNATLTPHVPRTFLFPSDVPFEEFQDIAYVSEGSGSMVFEAVWRGHQVVIKVIATTKAKDPIVLQEFEMEKVPEPYPCPYHPPTHTCALHTFMCMSRDTAFPREHVGPLPNSCTHRVHRLFPVRCRTC
jgi:hypothetical protein